jgi:hypothetical protein
MDRRSISLMLVLGPVACVESPSLGPPPENYTSPILTVGGDEIDDQSDEDANEGSDLPGCDPFVDPAQECGSGMDCDPDTQQCVEAAGNLMLGESCDVEGVGDPCSPGLICSEGRCREPCDPAANLDDPEALGTCATTDTCVLVGDDWGICVSACSLVLQDCEYPGEGCNRAQGSDGVVAACTRKPGSAGENEPCASDGDCLVGLLCTEQALHSTDCASMAASCCTFVCDAEQLPCVGTEPACYALGITGQAGAGYCGPLGP